MLNLKKVRSETKAAVFQKKEEREAIRINHYMKSDYVGFHMVQNAVSITIAFAIGVGWYIMYRAELLETAVNLSEFRQLLVQIGVIYLIALVLFELFTCVYYMNRYTRAHSKCKEYAKNLKRIMKLQEEKE